MPVDLEKIRSLCKRRGFIFPSSEIYGGLESTWDYGPLGVEMKNNVKRAWWRAVVYERDDMEGLDAAILMNRWVWKYSGHEDTFSDPLVDCRECKFRFRADQVIKDLEAKLFDEFQRALFKRVPEFGPALAHLESVLSEIERLEKEQGRFYQDRMELIVKALKKKEEYKKLLQSAALPDLTGVLPEIARRVGLDTWLEVILEVPSDKKFLPKFLPEFKSVLAYIEESERLQGRSYSTPFKLLLAAIANPIYKSHFQRLAELAWKLQFHLLNERGVLTCPKCGAKGSFTEPRMFNLMFKTFMGPVEDESALVYLRPETAQGIFVNFLNVQTTMRRKLPFGIAQIGKAFRNEITPGNFTFRTREFEQMEIEYFVKPGTDEEWFERWVEERFNWYLRLGIRRENLRRREQSPDELAHYAKRTIDIEYLFSIGWSEIEGIANRTDFDLRAHSKSNPENAHSIENLTTFDPETNEHITPYVIEPSAGVDRTMLAFLVDAYHEEEVRGGKRVVLKLHKELAPIKVAVLPLLRNRPEIVEMAKRIKRDLQAVVHTVYDDTGSIGRLYRRQDEIGTPFCVTVDVQSLEDQQVTIRDRDTMEQIRIAADQVKAYFLEQFGCYI